MEVQKHSVVDIIWIESSSIIIQSKGRNTA